MGAAYQKNLSVISETESKTSTSGTFPIVPHRVKLRETVTNRICLQILRVLLSKQLIILVFKENRQHPETSISYFEKEAEV